MVGRGKRAIEDHFTIDRKFLNELRTRGKIREAENLEHFYEMLSNSNIVWVNQYEPKGFGDAVLMAKPFVSDSRFVVAAGDTYITSKNNWHLKSILNANKDATLLLKKVSDPSQYGVALIDKRRVLKVIEKPKQKISNLAIMPFYSFSPDVFDHIKNVKSGYGNEVQLTDAIQSMIDSGKEVSYVVLKKVVWFDIGNPESYWKALRDSFKIIDV